MLREAAMAADLSIAASPQARERLAGALDELEAAGLATQPKARARWDQAARPPLPLHVTRTRLDLPATAALVLAPADPIWHALLWWVPAFLAAERPTTGERALLLGVQQLLGQSGGPPVRVVPLRERSLQLLGDEKDLDSLLRGRMFDDKRLSLELIGAERVVPTLSSVQTSTGPDLLLVENYATFHSMGRAMAGHRDVGRVVWGAGNQVTQLLPQITIAQGGRLWYFGDLDARVLEIGQGTAPSAAELGLPPLAPSADLYALLLRHGVRAKVKGRGPSAARVADAVAWLPEELRSAAAQLLSAGHRMAQEAVGMDLLASHPLPARLH